MCSENFLSGIGNSRRDGRAANPVRTEHGGITAAASAIFASANANSWPIGEHHAYGMVSISRWRKGDKRGGVYSLVEEGGQGGHNSWGNARSSGRICHGADQKHIVHQQQRHAVATPRHSFPFLSHALLLLMTTHRNNSDSVENLCMSLDGCSFHLSCM